MVIKKMKEKLSYGILCITEGKKIKDINDLIDKYDVEF